jgi:hypothetical protein
VTDAEILELINRAVEVAVQRSVKSVLVPQFLFGTVTDVNVSGPSIHEVMLDGDDTEEVAVMDVSGLTIAAGDRVAIAYAPPHQLWLIGIFPG